MRRLHQRIETKGVTAVVGRPEVGKTHILRHLRHELERDGKYLFGWIQASTAEGDLLLHAVSDLWSGWLSQASLRHQYGALKAQLKDRPGRVVFALGEMLGELTNHVDPTGALPGLIDKVFQSLRGADERLRTGGLDLAPVAYNRILKMLQLTAELSGRRPILVLDAIEQLSNPDREGARIEAMLRDFEGWPDVHVLMSSRNEPRDAPAIQCIDSFRRASACVEVIELSGMDLDEAETTVLLNHVRFRVPATTDIDEKQLLGWIGAHPGVLKRWREGCPVDAADLESLAAEAKAYRYNALRRQFELYAHGGLPEARFLARLAVLPEFTSNQAWQTLKPIVLEGLSNDLRLSLQARGILESSVAWASFGHTMAYEAARRFWLQEPTLKSYAADAASHLSRRLAVGILGLDAISETHAASLAKLPVENLAPEERVLVLSARTMFGQRLSAEEREGMINSAPTVAVLGEYLISIGLFITLNQAKDENDVTLRDRLLQGLRDLHATSPSDEAIRENLAKGLFNTLNDARDEGDLARRDRLLQELRDLHAASPDGPGVRAVLAMGLVNTSYDAIEEKDPPRRDRLLQELRDLRAAHLGDEAVRAEWRTGLLNALTHAESEKDIKRCHQLLQELRDLHTVSPDDDIVRKHLAMCLFNRLHDTKKETSPAVHGQILQELRELHAAKPGDGAVREQLVKGLFNTVNDASKEDNLALRDRLLQELREMHTMHPPDKFVTENLAMGLLNTFINTVEHNDWAAADTLANELRILPTSQLTSELASDIWNALLPWDEWRTK